MGPRPPDLPPAEYFPLPHRRQILFSAPQRAGRSHSATEPPPSKTRASRKPFRLRPRRSPSTIPASPHDPTAQSRDRPPVAAALRGPSPSPTQNPSSEFRTAAANPPPAAPTAEQRSANL